MRCCLSEPTHRVAGTGITGSTASYGGNIVATAVPEPETYVMMLAGLSAIGLLVRASSVVAVDVFFAGGVSTALSRMGRHAV